MSASSAATISLLQRMKLLHTRDEDCSISEHNAKGGSHEGLQEFAIKAVQAATQSGQQQQPSGRPVVRIHACASMPGSPAVMPGLGLPEQEHQEQCGSPVLRFDTTPLAASLERSPSAPSMLAAPAGALPQQEAWPSLQLPQRPEYCSIAQFTGSQELYRSSQSVVLKATCLILRQPVILKQYFKKKMSCRAVHKMKREVELMYLLRGEQGVCQILGDFQDDRHFCIVMEYYPGGDLYKRAMMGGKGDKSLSQQWICSKVIAPLLRVLSMLHEHHGIIHRDIKPENVFLTADDELKLGDFGLAIQQDRELPFLKAGTLDYMAPEVVQNPLVDCIDECPEYTASDLKRHGFTSYNEKVDVWAVGVLAYELMMQGETPFYHDEPSHTEKLILKCDLVEVKFPRQHLLSPWADFVRTTLQLDAARRPSAAQLLRHRWVQMHLQARQRLPHPPPRSASVMAALDRSVSLPPMALSADCRRAAVALGKAAPAVHGPLRASSAQPPVCTPITGLHLLADTTLVSATSVTFSPHAGQREGQQQAGGAPPSAEPSGSSAGASCRCATLTALPCRKCSHCMAGGSSGAASMMSLSPQDSDMAEAEGAEAEGAAGSGGEPSSPPNRCGILPPGAFVRDVESDPEMDTDVPDPEMMAPGEAPPRRTHAFLSLPLPRDLAAMRLAAPLGPPLLGPARAPTIAELSGAMLSPKLTAPASRSSSMFVAGSAAERRPSRLGLPPLASAGVSPALSAAWEFPAQDGSVTASASAAAAAAPTFVLPGPMNLRRMGRTGSVFRPPLPRLPSMGSMGSPSLASNASLSAHNSPSAAGASGTNPASLALPQPITSYTFGSGAIPQGGSAAALGDASAQESSMDRSDNGVRMATSGQRNRLVAYLRRQTASAVNLMRRLRVTRRTASTDCSDGSRSPTGSMDGSGSGLARRITAGPKSSSALK